MVMQSERGRDGRSIRIELLHIDECPHSEEAAERTAEALAALGLGHIPVHMRVLRSSADTAGTAFAGSPTITADGVDIFPALPVADLACRIYVTPVGPAGLPTVTQIMEALEGSGL